MGTKAHLGTYDFHQGTPPQYFSPDFEPALFNLPEFFSVHETTRWLSFYILSWKTKKIVASLHFCVKDGVARSPLKAPFGSVECRDNINPQLLFDFLTFVESELKKYGVVEIYLKNPPRAYAPNNLSLLETFLLNQKYIVTDAETGATIPVNDTPFTNLIRHSEMLRYKQAQNAGFDFKPIPEENIGAVYQYISGCHKEKGYTISISENDLKNTVRKFPGRYCLFGIFDGDKLAGASISILVKKNILYNFLVNHPKKYNRLSPPVLLMEGLYNYCQRNAISLLDLGTSALDGKPNFSLLDFKLHLGGMPTTKLTFYKKLD